MPFMKQHNPNRDASGAFDEADVRLKDLTYQHLMMLSDDCFQVGCGLLRLLRSRTP